jgi:hypothetical protein
VGGVLQDAGFGGKIAGARCMIIRMMSELGEKSRGGASASGSKH